MILTLLVSVLSLFLFSSFSTYYHLSYVNKTVVYTPIEIFESSITIVNPKDEDNLCFDKTTLKTKADNYYLTNLNGHLTQLSIHYYYYNQSDHSICTTSYCNAVEIVVSGKYSFFFDYSKKVSYEIHRGRAYE